MPVKQISGGSRWAFPKWASGGSQAEVFLRTPKPCFNCHTGMPGDLGITSKDPRCRRNQSWNFPMVPRSGLPQNPCFPQDSASGPLEGCSSSSYRHRFSSNTKGRVPSTGLLYPLPPAAAGFPGISQVQTAHLFLHCCLRHNHQVRQHSTSISVVG